MIEIKLKLPLAGAEPLSGGTEFSPGCDLNILGASTLNHSHCGKNEAAIKEICISRPLYTLQRSVPSPYSCLLCASVHINFQYFPWHVIFHRHGVQTLGFSSPHENVADWPWGPIPHVSSCLLTSTPPLGSAVSQKPCSLEMHSI